jgi:thymidylate kinase
VQVLRHEQNAYYFVLSWPADGGPRFLHVDVCGDYRRFGILFLRADELLPFRRREEVGFWVLSPAKEFIYYLLKKVDKGALDDRQGRHLSECWSKDEHGARAEVDRFWQGRDADLLKSAAASRAWQPVVSNMRRLKVALRRKVRRSPLAAIGELGRRVDRVLRPTGFVVAMLGADGSGKTSVLKLVQERMAPAFRRVGRYHLRPFVIGRRVEGAAAVTDPHGAAPRGVGASVAKLGYFLADYVLGASGPILRDRIYSTLVLFDRYVHDLQVDPRRYRFGAPVSLARWTANVSPQPDLFIVLDAPAQVMRARKEEVQLEELERLRARYRDLAQRLGPSKAVLIDASRPLDRVGAEVCAAILARLAERTASRLGL